MMYNCWASIVVQSDRACSCRGYQYILGGGKCGFGSKLSSNILAP